MIGLGTGLYTRITVGGRAITTHEHNNAVAINTTNIVSLRFTA